MEFTEKSSATINDAISSKPECTIYKTQWRAFYKPGLGSPTIVYGESIDEATRNALAEFRRTNGILDSWPANRIIDRVEIIG